MEVEGWGLLGVVLAFSFTHHARLSLHVQTGGSSKPRSLLPSSWVFEVREILLFAGEAFLVSPSSVVSSWWFVFWFFVWWAGTRKHCMLESLSLLAPMPGKEQNRQSARRLKRLRG